MTVWIVLGALLALVVVALVARKGRQGAPATGGRLALEETAEVAATSLREVTAANERCARARGDDFAAAWRDLHAVLATSVSALDGLRGRDLSPRLVRMVRLTVEELWEESEPWLSAHTPTTAEDLTVLHGALWERVEAGLAAHEENRGEQRAAARGRLVRLRDQVGASLAALESGPAPEPQVRTWRLAAEEVGKFLDDALAARPGGQQS